MNVVSLTDAETQSTAKIAVDNGFNCFEYQARFDGQTVDVLDAGPEFVRGEGRPSGHGIPILFPFPNRIHGSEFSWDGQTYRMSAEDVGVDPNGHAIHGFCLDRPWRIVDQGMDFVVGEFKLSQDAPERASLWPADFIIRIRYSVAGGPLRGDVTIINPDDKILPWGLGTHPYFKLPLSPASEPSRCLIESPVTQMWITENCLPNGETGPVPPEKALKDGAYFDVLKLDDVYTGLEMDSNGLISVIYDETAGLQVVQRCDRAFREMVAFTPADRAAICLEPYTCVTDAINLDHANAHSDVGTDAGLQVLAPGEETTLWFEISAGPVLA